MRTSPQECRELGRQIGRKLSAATGPTALFVPLKGVSMIAVEGQPFHDPAADAALREGLAEGLDRGSSCTSSTSTSTTRSSLSPWRTGWTR
jgi:uncharacterized protein (UPF0261 family)